MKFKIAIISQLLAATSLFAETPPPRAIPISEVKYDFEEIMKLRKGPFGQNHLVDYTGVQAAFRNEQAQLLATKHGVYIGNGFATNYRELYADYVKKESDPETHSFGALARYGRDVPDDYQIELASVSEEAFPKASSMVKNWVLEKYYVAEKPDSKLAASYGIKGISGFEFEVPFAKAFFNFYLAAIAKRTTATERAYAYLPTFSLLQVSPMKDSNALSSARSLVDGYSGGGSEQNRRLYRLRNMIHNQPSPQVIEEIDRFKDDYPNSTPSSLISARSKLVEYFSVSSSKIASEAKSAGQLTLKEIADALSAKNLQEDKLVLLQKLANESIATKRKLLSGEITTQLSATLLVLSTVSQYLTKEAQLLSNTIGVNKGIVQLLVSAVYLEGLLITRNYDALSQSIAASTSNQELSKLLEVTFSTAQTTLQNAFKNELEVWKQIETKMEDFIDDTLKASPLAVFDQMKQKLEGNN